MSHQICPKCSRSVEPLERIEHEKKSKKTWLIKYCPNERCNFNLDIEPTNVKLWNERSKYFEDLTDAS